MCPLLTFHVEFFIICLPHVRSGFQRSSVSSNKTFSALVQGSSQSIYDTDKPFFCCCFFFNFHLCLFYLYQWWLTFKLLFCVFFIFLSFLFSLQFLLWLIPSFGDFRMDGSEEANRNSTYNLFIYNFIFFLLLFSSALFPCLFSWRIFQFLPGFSQESFNTGQAKVIWIEINVFFM